MKLSELQIGPEPGDDKITLEDDGTVTAVAFVGDGSGLTGIAGSGDVDGPAGATDLAVARFDGGTGKLLQDSAVTIADTTGTITTPGDIVMAERADHASTPGAGYGYLWTKNTTPSTLIFTDDAGTDTTLGSGGGITALTGDVTASGSGSVAATIAAGAVDIAMLSATGTPSGTTFLRGDNTWATPAGSGDVSDGGTLATGLTFPNTGLHILDTNASHDLIIAPGSDLSADRTLTVTTGDSNRTLTMTGDASITGTNTGDQTITLTGDVTGTGTGSFAATVDKTTITGKSTVTLVGGDSLLISDASDTGNLKKCLASDLVLAVASTDNAVARFDSTSGQIQNSAVTIADTSGNMAGVGTLNTHTIPAGTDTFAMLAATQTLTNKRVTPRTGTTTSSATPTINTDNVEHYSITAQTEAITSMTTNLSGTPTERQVLTISITGTAARAITWGASFENGPVALPSTTDTTKRLDVLFWWNSTTSKWRCMASGSTA